MAQLMKNSILTVVLMSSTIISCSYATTPSLSCFLKAYHPYVNYHQGWIYMQNGKKIVWNDGKNKNFNEKLTHPDLKDTLSIPYPAFTPIQKKLKINEDPGRIRNQKLLEAVYGSTKNEIDQSLIYVKWLPYAKIKRVRFNRRNGAAAALKKVVTELKQLPQRYHKYLTHIGGTYNYRNIKGTNRLSPHSYGITIDISTRYGDYWRYTHHSTSTKKLKYKNRIPYEIVQIFERHGFIWGGRWYHYDTMHFEYRPELVCS